MSRHDTIPFDGTAACATPGGRPAGPAAQAFLRRQTRAPVRGRSSRRPAGTCRMLAQHPGSGLLVRVPAGDATTRGPYRLSLPTVAGTSPTTGGCP